MNNEERKELVDDIQKDIVSSCFTRCFDLQTLTVQDKCAKSCYKQYMTTIINVTELIKNKAYENHSLFAYKAFPKHNPHFDIVYGERFKSHKNTQAFAFDYVSQKKV